MEFESAGFRNGRKRWSSERNLRRSNYVNQPEIQPTYETESGIQTRAVRAVGESFHHLQSPTAKRTILYFFTLISII